MRRPGEGKGFGLSARLCVSNGHLRHRGMLLPHPAGLQSGRVGACRGRQAGTRLIPADCCRQSAPRQGVAEWRLRLIGGPPGAPFRVDICGPRRQKATRKVGEQGSVASPWPPTLGLGLVVPPSSPAERLARFPRCHVCRIDTYGIGERSDPRAQGLKAAGPTPSVASGGPIGGAPHEP